jgi:hypothetical protein
MVIAVWVALGTFLIPMTARAHAPGGLFVVVLSVALLVHSIVSLIVGAVAAGLLRAKRPFLAIFWRSAIGAWLLGTLLVALVIGTIDFTHDWTVMLTDATGLLAGGIAGAWWAVRLSKKTEPLKQRSSRA